MIEGDEPLILAIGAISLLSSANVMGALVTENLADMPTTECHVQPSVNK